MSDINLNNPSDWELSTWILCVGMAIFGGVANWANRIARGYITHFSFVELMGEMFVSGFIGVSVFMTLAGMGKPLLICAAASGISGHFATRIIFHVEQILKAKAEKTINDIKINMKARDTLISTLWRYKQCNAAVYEIVRFDNWAVHYRDYHDNDGQVQTKLWRIFRTQFVQLTQDEAVEEILNKNGGLFL